MAGFKKYDRSKLGRDSDRLERSGFGRRERSGGRGGERSAPRYGGRDSDRPRGGFGDRDRPYQEQFDVICDTCGKECKVPFKPTRGKPVYCSECFSKKSSEPSRESSGGDLDEINRKLDKIMRALDID